MRLSLSWLRHYFTEDLDSKQVAHLLQDSGIETDAIEQIRPKFSGVIVGKVLSVEKHPQADKLVVAKVSDGKKHHQVVCGASNCKPDLLVAFAPIGSRIGSIDDPKSMVIKQAQLRGVDSFGMLAAADELGLEEKSSGIMELDPSLVPGDSLDALFTDDVLELSLTPDLGHALSVLGIARLLSARTGTPVKMPINSFEALEELASLKDGWQVQVEDKDLCPRYSALVLSNVSGGKTALWMQLLLQRCGFRLINALVDCSNFVMMSIGQPLHCFDTKAFPSQTIRVGYSGTSHDVQLIDGQTVTVPVGTATISGAFGIEAVAGVMGAQSSAVTELTNSCVVESAYFSPQAVRRAKVAIGASSESSRRFERGSDPDATIMGLALYLNLLQKLDIKVSINALLDIHSKKMDVKDIPCRLARVVSVLGVPISAQEMEWVWNRHNFPLRWVSQEVCMVSVPPRRHDLNEEIDLVEEVWKLLPQKTVNASRPLKPDTHANHPLYTIEARARKALIQAGLQEWINCSLISPQAASSVTDGVILKAKNSISVEHPMSIEQSVLRPSLLPGMLESYRRNQNVKERDCQAFEVGIVHMRDESGKPTERLLLAILLAGSRAPYQFDQSDIDVDFLDLKAVVEEVSRLLSISPLLDSSEVSHLHPGRQAALYVHGARAGVLGEVHPLLLKQFDIKERVLFAEIDLQDYMQQHGPSNMYQSLNQFPGMERDWTGTVNDKLTYGRLEQLIRQDEPEFLEHFRLQSIFRSERIGQDKKNMTIRFYFRSPERTLNQEEVDASFQQLIQSISAQLSQEHLL